MRPSPKRHPIAILRTLLGLLQKDLANLVDRSPRTIQGIELLKVPLGEKLAEEISFETGVSKEWLLSKDPSQPIVDEKGQPYTKTTYEDHRAFRECSTGSKYHLEDLTSRFNSLITQARHSEDAPRQLWKVQEALRQLELEYYKNKKP